MPIVQLNHEDGKRTAKVIQNVKFKRKPKNKVRWKEEGAAAAAPFRAQQRQDRDSSHDEAVLDKIRANATLTRCERAVARELVSWGRLTMVPGKSNKPTVFKINKGVV